MSQPQAANPLGTEKEGKLLLKFAVPSVISLVINSLYNMVDQIFIGQGVGVPGKWRHQHHRPHYDHLHRGVHLVRGWVGRLFQLCTWAWGRESGRPRAWATPLWSPGRPAWC